MKILTEQEAREKCEFVFIEHDCGFHLALDATYLEQVANIILNCPACLAAIDMEDVT